MTTKIAAGLALLLALSGWGLYRQISANGELQQQLQQRDEQLRAEQSRVQSLRLEIEERDEAVRILEARNNDLRNRETKVQTIVREVYVEPEVQEWARTAPPHPVVAAVRDGIDELWNDGASGGDSDGSAVPAGGDGG